MTRTCKVCSIEKPITDFYKNSKKPHVSYSHVCKRCTLDRRKATVTPEIRKDSILRHRYGISLERYNEMLAEQNGVCLICELPPLEGKVLVVDHCHTTARVRGLLHSNCNSLLGMAKDNPVVLKNAIRYLNQ
jgi:hypothetical protein